MTQAERLIRNLCEERRLQVVDGEREAIKQVPDSTSWKDLPNRIREAVREYRRIEKQQRRLQKCVAAAGFHTHNLYVGKGLSLINHSQRQAAIRSRYDTRRQAIQKLRTDALIEALGKSANEAQEILKKLQKDLRLI